MNGRNILGVVALCLCFSAAANSQWIDNCPRQVTWSLEDAAVNNRSCILMTGVYEFLVPYQKTTVDAVMNTTAVVSISPNASVTGSCGSAVSKEEQITLTWPTPDAINSTSDLPPPESHTVTFVFSKNSSSKSSDVDAYYCLQRVTATLRSNPVEFPDDAEPGKVYTLQGQKLASLSTPLGLSYFCSTRQELPLDMGSLRLEHTQFEVFHKAPLKGDGTDFGSRSYCAVDGFRMLITAVVLISILVGTGAFAIYLCRRKAKKSSYNSLD